MSEEARLREQIAELGKSLYDRGLTVGSSGNISARCGEHWLLTPTNSCLGRLDPARISLMDADGRLISGDPPSKETFMHQAMYLERPQSGAVVHLHSIHSVAVSCLADLDAHQPIPPLTPYYVMRVGELALLPYFPPGDRSLADALRALASRHHAVLLANHGPVVAGNSLEAAVYAIEELEETARLYLLLQGLRTRTLTTAQVEDLHRRFPS